MGTVNEEVSQRHNRQTITISVCNNFGGVFGGVVKSEATCNVYGISFIERSGPQAIDTASGGLNEMRGAGSLRPFQQRGRGRDIDPENVRCPIRKIGVVFALRKINDSIDLARQKAGEFGIAQIGLYELQVGFHSRPNAPETDRQNRTGQLAHDFPAEQA